MEELEKRGISCSLVVDKNLDPESSRFRIVPAFNTRMGLAFRPPFAPQALSRLISSVVGNLVTSWDLMRRVTPLVVSGDLVLLCRPLSRTRVAYGLWLWSLKALRRPLTIIYVIHNEPEPLFASQLRILRRLARGHRLKFVAHSPAIAEQLGDHLGLQPKVIALPFKAVDFEERPATGSRPVRFSFLGLGHRSKGLDLVLQAMELSVKLIEANKLEFTIQCYLPFRDRGSDGLHRDVKNLAMRVGGVEVIDHELTTSDYVHELKRADIVLIPHRLETYRFALSGVFADAIGAGRPVIVAEGSYMSELVRESGAGLTFKSGNGVSFQSAIVEAAGQADQLLHLAKTARERWVREQGPEAFVSGLFQVYELPLATSGP